MKDSKVFIASSSENLEAAYAIQELLSGASDCTVWAHGFFNLSGHLIAELENALEIMDFAVFVLLPDDLLRIRGEELSAVRDNVIFELGLFIGRLGRARTYVIAPIDIGQLRIPSDLSGVIMAPVDLRDAENYTNALGPACTQIRRQMKSLGPVSRAPGVLFSTRIEGIGDIKELIRQSRHDIIAVGPTLAYVAQYLESYLFNRARRCKSPTSRNEKRPALHELGRRAHLRRRARGSARP